MTKVEPGISGKNRYLLHTTAPNKPQVEEKPKCEKATLNLARDSDKLPSFKVWEPALKCAKIVYIQEKDDEFNSIKKQFSYDNNKNPKLSSSHSLNDSICGNN